MEPSIAVRPWTRIDRSRVERWERPDLPAHWLTGMVEPGRRESYAIDRGAELVGRITLRGFGVIAVGLEPWHVARIGIYLRPDCYGQGIGTAALQAFLELSQLIGLDLLRLDVAIDNERAIRCYEKVGFVRAKQLGSLLEMERVIAPGRAIRGNALSQPVC